MLQGNVLARDVVFPYLVGEDLNSSANQEARRWVINFMDYPEERARQYPACFSIVEQRVKPQRGKINRERNRRFWWQFAETRPGLYNAIAELARVLVIANTSKLVQPAFVAAQQVLDKQLTVFAYDDDFHFGVLTSSLHWWWAVARASTMRTDLRYTPTDCFETFPQPSYDTGVQAAGRALNEHRGALMIRNDEGLTKTYNRVHNPDDDSPGIAELRKLHVALDLAVGNSYGWSDLDIAHSFHDTPQGRRFTLGPVARTEVLDRLLKLNHERYAEEIAAGLHERRKVAKGRQRRLATDAPTLL